MRSSAVYFNTRVHTNSVPKTVEPVRFRRVKPARIVRGERRRYEFKKKIKNYTAATTTITRIAIMKTVTKRWEIV